MASQWFATWFDSPHYHKLYGYRDDSEAARFVDALIDRLRPGPDAHLLDLGCGAGRHAKHLASKGFQVTGVDLAARSIAEARQAPAETKVVDGVTCGLTRWSDARHFFKRIEIAETPGSQPLVYVEKVAKFTLQRQRVGQLRRAGRHRSTVSGTTHLGQSDV